MMLRGPIYQAMLAAKAEGRKQLAVLIDPDKAERLPELLTLCQVQAPDYFLIGGSLMLSDKLDYVLEQLKTHCPQSPSLLFPGSSRQLSYRASGILLLSLISGRNPELLIGKHVEVAPFLKRSPLEVLSTGYMLIDGGRATSVSYISHSQPIPADKPDIALCTAMAGEQLGMGLIYMDAGSGALQAVPLELIEAVSQGTDIPLIVGGGIRSLAQAQSRWQAGADILVIGNVLEKEPGLLRDLLAAR